MSVKVITRSTETGPIMFFPDVPANKGMIYCWTIREGHSEASMEYYRTTKPASQEEREKLLSYYYFWYDVTDPLEVKRGDHAAYQVIRWQERR